MKFYETVEFKKINRKWKKKLKASGFKDIESNEFTLQHFSYEIAYKHNTFTLDYYSKCDSFLLTHTFPNQIDKLIWQMHADGKSVRQIEAYLLLNGISEISYRTVHNKIKAIEAVMLQRSA